MVSLLKNAGAIWTAREHENVCFFFQQKTIFPLRSTHHGSFQTKPSDQDLRILSAAFCMAEKMGT
jgi:hypothetical protein